MSTATSLQAHDCNDGPQPRFLPAPLINARAAVLNRQFCQDLSRTARKALYGVLAFYRLGHPEQPVFAYRDKLQAETLLDSRSSLYRGLQEVEEKGYLRREQIRSRGATCYGRYSRSHIFLLDKALVMLGLEPPRRTWEAATDPTPAEKDMQGSANDPVIEVWEGDRDNWQDDGSEWEDGSAPQDPASSATYPQGPCTTVVHRLLEGEPTLNLQLKGQLPTRSAPGSPYPVKDSDKEVGKKRRLPNDVLPLREQLGVSQTLIFSLMSFARSQGHQGKLGTVVKLFWRHIEALKGRSVYAYLRKILSQKRDFTRMLSVQESESLDGCLQPDAVRRLEDKLTSLLARADGWQVRNAKGDVIGTFHSNGCSGHIAGFDSIRGRYAIPANARLMQALEEGRLMMRPVVC